MKLCQYNETLGKPGKGFHEHFGSGIAVLDLAGTAFMAYMIGKRLNMSFAKVFTWLMALAVVSHKLFCVDTTCNRFLFG
jgi:hypothetical protein